MLYHGTGDDNVHPSNLLQFIQALQSCGKHFEVQLGPDQGHGSLHEERMLEFFVDALDWPGIRKR
jgi:dipeptidyl-peptidase-4